MATERIQEIRERGRVHRLNTKTAGAVTKDITTHRFGHSHVLEGHRSQNKKQLNTQQSRNRILERRNISGLAVARTEHKHNLQLQQKVFGQELARQRTQEQRAYTNRSNIVDSATPDISQPSTSSTTTAVGEGAGNIAANIMRVLGIMIALSALYLLVSNQNTGTTIGKVGKILTNLTSGQSFFVPTTTTSNSG